MQNISATVNFLFFLLLAFQTQKALGETVEKKEVRQVRFVSADIFITYDQSKDTQKWRLSEDKNPDILQVLIENSTSKKVCFHSLQQQECFIVKLDEQIDFNLQVGEKIYPTRIIGVSNAKSLVFKKFWEDKKLWDTPYKENLSLEEKLAGLSKIWMEAKYNFVFFDHIPNVHWDQLYFEYIPKVMQTKNTVEYYIVLMKFMDYLKDGHTGAWFPDEIAPNYRSLPKVQVKLVEGKLLITKVKEKNTTIKVGDEVVKVDGKDIHQIAEANRYSISSSTPQYKTYRVYSERVLNGKANSLVHLTLKNPQGKLYQASLKRFKIKGDEDLSVESRKIGKTLYINIRSLVSDEFEQVKKIVAEAKDIDQYIIDLRECGGGNSSIGFDILHLFSNKEIASMEWQTRKYQPAHRFWNYYKEIIDQDIQGIDFWTDIEKAKFPRSIDMKPFEKHVHLLVGAYTFSAAEDMTIAFRSLNIGKIIGSKTGGSTGQPLVFSLPGGGGARVCAKRDYGPNKKEWVGFGIEPDILVEQTIEDLRNGEDTVLEKSLSLFP